MPDGRRILCAEDRTFAFVTPQTGERTVARTMPHHIDNQFDVGPDGAWVYASMTENLTEIWIATPTSSAPVP